MPVEKDLDETTLLALLKQGSAQAFQSIFHQYGNKVYGIAIAYVKLPFIAEEVLQDVFLKLWSQRDKLEDVQSLEAWIYTITKNTVLNNLSRKANEDAAKKILIRETLPSESTADHKIRSAQYRQLLSNAIGQLSKQQQIAYTLAKEEGLTYEQIGVKLSLSSLTVKKHMARALSSIREYLKTHG